MFTVVCRSGIIYEADGTMTELFTPNRYDYYYFDLEYPDGTYLYVSNLKDSVWFSISQEEFYYENNNNSMFNDEFEIQR